MGKLAVALVVAAALCCAIFWPVQGRSFWQRAEERGLQRAAARLAARGLRSAWDFVARHEDPAHAAPAHPPQRRALRRAELARAAPPVPAPAAARPAAGPDRIVAQPARETLRESDRAALDALVRAR